MITDYEILEDDSSDKLIAAVREWMTRGWEPLGGVSVACWVENRGSQHDERTETTYTQAIVKYDTK